MYEGHFDEKLFEDFNQQLFVNQPIDIIPGQEKWKDFIEKAINERKLINNFKPFIKQQTSPG